MMKIPYGSVGTFNDLVTQGYLYVDRTMYLEKLEALNKKHLFFLRPRRFGKSLFVSVLEHYYGLEHQDKFDRLFGKYYIGQNPTPLRNSYLVLKFNFSGINTATNETTHKGFLSNVRIGISRFLKKYSSIFNPKNLEVLQNISAPEIMLNQLWYWVQTESQGKKVYVLIDEYDQFTNEMVAYRFEEFKKVVGRNGWIRKFYETLKIGADDGIIDRTFITGVTPVTLDSLTSGFSIASDLSTDFRFGEMMGFMHEEVKDILKKIGVEEDDLED
ncbi:MAG: AAA family ATPase, partial [Chitinophagales bacterium]